MSESLRGASTETNRESWRRYYSGMAEQDDSGKFEAELRRTTYTHAWSNSVRTILEKGQITDGLTVLDAGCGWGRMLLGVVDQASDLDITALDAQQDALDLGSSLLRDAPNGNRIAWSVGDLEALDLEDSTYDVVYSARVFQHLAHPEKGAAELLRVLKPGGRFVLFLQNRLCPLNAGYYAKMYSPGELRDWFEGLDTTVLRVGSMDFYPNALQRALSESWRLSLERGLEGLPGLNRLGGKAVAWGVK